MTDRRIFALLFAWIVSSSSLSFAAPQSSPATRPADAKWQSLFDGKTLGKWVSTNFGGEGEVHVEDGALYLDPGVSLTGVNYTGEVPKMNYEVALDAQRIEGSDFFCGLTVPVADSHVTLIIGGWGGTLCGISSIDGDDAARNDTKTLHAFKKKQWYHIRMRVLPDKLMAWLDDEKIVNVTTKGHELSLRGEVLASRPFGICAYQTAAALKNIRIRELTAEEKQPAKK